MEKGDRQISELDGYINEIYARLASKRAEFIAEQHSGGDSQIVWQHVEARLEEIAAHGWSHFRSVLEEATGGIVFTAHPTFALPIKVRDAIATHAVTSTHASEAALSAAVTEDGRDWSKSISLMSEHKEAQSALYEAQGALNVYAARLFAFARARFPDDWKSFRPHLPTLASWVGYDLDGRTDIVWWHSVAFRLSEKAVQLKRYADRVESIGDTAALGRLAARLHRAAELSEEEARLFSKDLSDEDALIAAVSLLSEPHADRLVSSRDITQAIDEIVAASDDDLAEALLILRAEIETLQLGTGRIHLRVNAAQVRAVIRRDLGLETEDRELGRLALEQLCKKAASDEKEEASFAKLFQEQSTARRQILMCGLWLKHIDGDAPIRFLIAEAENPATVMGTVYMARQFGIEDKLDISPLFETPDALETGGRFIQRLLQERQFLLYLKARGYLSIQLGFSDAGRFIGQVAANLAIERIHNLVIQALAQTDEKFGLLIFNTHGESFGRGAWPGSFQNRLNYALTAWTRAQAHKAGIALQHEVSFQGGDGFLRFSRPELAETAYGEVCVNLLSDADPELDDPFYDDSSFTWDVYRALRTWHERLFNDPDYGELLSDFATNFQVRAGSRQKRRSGGPKGPRALRAISHNATLQQIGAPVNTAAGLGSAVRREQDRLIKLLNQSPRLRQLMDLALYARQLTTIPALRAYGRVYDPSFWVSIARPAEHDKALAYRRMYYRLNDETTFNSITRIANRFSIDLSKFDRLLASLDTVPSSEERHEERLNLHVLHGLRQAMMLHAMSLAAHLPALSRRFDTDAPSDFMTLILEMRLDEAIQLLKDAFPKSVERTDLFEKLGGTPGDPPERGYDDIHEKIIAPLEDIHRLFHKSTLAICQAYGAYG